MAQIGVKVIIVPVEGRFREARLMDMSHDLTLSGWATDSNDPDSFFRPLLSCAAIASQTNLPTGNRSLTCCKSARSSSPRGWTPQRGAADLARELPVLPLASSLRLQAYRYDMKGRCSALSVTLRSLAYRGKIPKR